MGSGGFPADGALEAELTVLRARAYGADADIDADPEAVARLAELEERHAASMARALGEATADRGTTPATTRPPAERRRGVRGWWRRTNAGAMLTGVTLAIAAALAVAAWAWWTGPRPDVTLRPTGAAPSDQVLRLSDYARRQLVVKSTLRAFEPVMGMEVWSATSVLGNTCLLVFEPASDELLAVGCAPPPAEPIAEIYDVPVEWEEEWVDRFPTGTVVRFMLTGDEVDVWIYEGGSVGESSGM